ncbi:hypothetical protein CHARACLAT_033306, partial [Characodon lateralis]|nr:hypothetical protein [Characodon lateralis]
TKKQTGQYIKLRGENDHLFTGAKNSAIVAWRTVLEKMGQQGKVTPLQAQKKDCKYPGSGEGVSEKPTAATWPWFVLMDEVLGQRSSTTPPVLIASIPEDTPGPSGAVGNQAEKDDSEPAGRGQKRKRDRDDGVDQGGHEGTNTNASLNYIYEDLLKPNNTDIPLFWWERATKLSISAGLCSQ